jgi:hypothetical protein
MAPLANKKAAIVLVAVENYVLPAIPVRECP